MKVYPAILVLYCVLLAAPQHRASPAKLLRVTGSSFPEGSQQMSWGCEMVAAYRSDSVYQLRTLGSTSRILETSIDHGSLAISRKPHAVMLPVDRHFYRNGQTYQTLRSLTTDLSFRKAWAFRSEQYRLFLATPLILSIDQHRCVISRTPTRTHAHTHTSKLERSLAPAQRHPIIRSTAY